MSDSARRLCHWTMRLASGLSAGLFGIVLIPLWTLKGSSHMPGIALWFAIVAFFIRCTYGGAIRRKNHLLIRSPFWTHRIRWSDIRGVDLVRDRHRSSSGL